MSDLFVDQMISPKPSIALQSFVCFLIVWLNLLFSFFRVLLLLLLLLLLATCFSWQIFSIVPLGYSMSLKSVFRLLEQDINRLESSCHPFNNYSAPNGSGYV